MNVFELKAHLLGRISIYQRRYYKFRINRYRSMAAELALKDNNHAWDLGKRTSPKTLVYLPHKKYCKLTYFQSLLWNGSTADEIVRNKATGAKPSKMGFYLEARKQREGQYVEVLPAYDNAGEAHPDAFIQDHEGWTNKEHELLDD